jgi:Ca2+-binding RTX toxin-like protein
MSWPLWLIAARGRSAMALYIIDTNSFNSGLLANNDEVLQLAGSVISSSGALALGNGLLVAVSYAIRGTLIGSRGLDAGASARVFLDTSALVSSFNLHAIEVFGGSTINNRGTIEASGIAIILKFDLTAGTSIVYNHGVILGSNAIDVQAANTGTARVYNYGSIIGRVLAIEFASGDDVVINAGNITGNIELGGGADYFDTANGLLSGAPRASVSGEAGNDTLIGGVRGELLDGGEDADRIHGGGGDDSIRGGLGADTLNGGEGADSIDGGSEVDWLHYTTSTEGVAVDLIAGTGLGGDAEGDVISAIENVFGSQFDDDISGTVLANHLAGGKGNDTLFGNEGNDLLQGDVGNDLLDGWVGLDTLLGGAGNDTLIGGLGKDLLTGAGGLDVIRFESIAESGVAFADRDVINTFARGDRIDLAAIDANVTLAGDQAFSFIGAAALTGAGQVNAVNTAGTNWLISISTDADAAAEMTLTVLAAPGFTGILAVDFIL